MFVFFYLPELIDLYEKQACLSLNSSCIFLTFFYEKRIRTLFSHTPPILDAKSGDTNKPISESRGAFRGGADAFTLQGFDPLTNQKVLLCYYFMTSILGRPTLKFLPVFSNGSLIFHNFPYFAQITRFFGQNFPKKTAGKRHF